MFLLEVRDVFKTYPDGTEALSLVRFHVEKGEGVVMLGHNGSGKSTLFKCINGLEPVSRGSIWVNGANLNVLNGRKLRRARSGIGMVFQHNYLIGNISVFQNVLFGALGQVGPFFRSFNLFASDNTRKKAMQSLDRVGLAEVAGRRAASLSGGQQQRVAIARMLMQECELVLADEPIASLDPSAGAEVMDLLWEIVREKGMTVICTLHQPEIARKYADRIIGLQRGKLVMDKPVGELDDEALTWLYDHKGEDKASHQVPRKKVAISV